MKADFILILAACGSRKEAAAIASALVKKKLAGCASVTAGINSIFRWNGKVDTAGEFLILIKTRSANFKKVERQILRMHSYDVPEILGVPIIAGSEEYLKWLRAAVIVQDESGEEKM